MNNEGKNSRPLIGVSHCLLGENVRYNGQIKQSSVVCELSEHFELLPVCPEVAVGLSVPRPPIELVRLAGSIRALGVDDRGLDPTDELADYAKEVIRKYPLLSGFVLKARSPSCGLKVGVHGFSGEELGHSAEGVFVNALRQQLPRLPVIDEEALMDIGISESFMEEVNRYLLEDRLD